VARLAIQRHYPPSRRDARLEKARISTDHAIHRVAWSTPEEIDVADLFVSKAASDLAAARSLAADSEQSDDMVGFQLDGRDLR
jgi:hypothetical protein